MKLFKDNRGAAVVEFALVVVPVVWFMLGIIQTGYVMWVDNLLNIAVQAASRCGGVGSTTPPCTGPTLANMKSTAAQVFSIGNASNFTSATCSAGNVGLNGSYTVTIVILVNVTLTAHSCYPVVSS